MLLIATENGYGKRTTLEDFPVQGRGGQGVIAIQTTERNGRVIGALQVSDDDEIMLISSGGTLVRTPTADISVMGIDEEDRLVGLERVEGLQDDDSEP